MRKVKLVAVLALSVSSLVAFSATPSASDLSVMITLKPEKPHTNERIVCSVTLTNVTDHVVTYGKEAHGEMKVEVIDSSGENRETHRDDGTRSERTPMQPIVSGMLFYVKAHGTETFRFLLHPAHDELDPGDYKVRVGILVKDAGQFAFSNTVIVNVLP